MKSIIRQIFLLLAFDVYVILASAQSTKKLFNYTLQTL